MYILSNQTHLNGAASILYQNVLKDFAEKQGKDLFILPSSVNELIILNDQGQDPGQLLEIVKEVNRTQVPQSEFLSDSVYHYSAGEDQFRRILPDTR